MKPDLTAIKDAADCREIFRRFWPDHFIERGNCRCPFHEDRTASLQVTKELAFCHAENAKWDALDLYKIGSGMEFRDAVIALSEELGLTFPEQRGSPERPQKTGGKGKIVATYDYTDGGGELLYQVCRMEPKSFRQRRPGPMPGEWIWNLQGVRSVLYRLPEVIAAETVFVVEGEKDADNLHTLGLVGTTNPMGAGKFIPEMAYVLKGKRVVIFPDKDGEEKKYAGQRHGQDVAGKCFHAGAKSVKVVELPGKGKDVSDWLAYGGDKAQLLKLVEQAPEWKPDGGDGPVILLEGGELHNVAEECLVVLRKIGCFFERGGELVEIANGKIFPVPPGRIAVVLTEAIRFERLDKRTERRRCVDCPDSLSRVLIDARAVWGLPTLSGVISAPVMAPSGRIVETPGHDPETGLFLSEFSGWEAIPESPGPKDFRQAVELLWTPFQDFPFVSPEDRGACLAAILTAVIRPALPTAPGFLVEAPTAGTGKSLLSFALAALSGSEPAIIPRCRDDDEIRKRLLALARGGVGCLLLDNLTGGVDSDSLCAYLTSPTMTDRILGASTMSVMPTNTLVVLNGNNPRITGDLNRRLIRIRLDAECEKPFLRQFDSDPVEFVQKHRMAMVRAALMLLGAKKPRTRGDIGSFPAWSRLVRETVSWIDERGFLDVGVGDPADTINEAVSADPDARRLGELLTVWAESFGPAGSTCREVIKRSGFSGNEELREILLEVCGVHGKLEPRRLGNWIDARKGRIIEGLRFIKSGTYQHAIIWAAVGGEF